MHSVSVLPSSLREKTKGNLTPEERAAAAQAFERQHGNDEGQQGQCQLRRGRDAERQHRLLTLGPAHDLHADRHAIHQTTGHRSDRKPRETQHEGRRAFDAMACEGFGVDHPRHLTLADQAGDGCEGLAHRVRLQAPQHQDRAAARGLIRQQLQARAGHLQRDEDAKRARGRGLCGRAAESRASPGECFDVGGCRSGRQVHARRRGQPLCLAIRRKRLSRRIESGLGHRRRRRVPQLHRGVEVADHVLGAARHALVDGDHRDVLAGEHVVQLRHLVAP